MWKKMEMVKTIYVKTIYDAHPKINVSALKMWSMTHLDP
jgi:hypothetical protein